MDKIEFITKLEEVKKQLPVGIIPLFIKRYPSFDTYKKRSKLQNILSGKVQDEKILKMLEELAQLITK